MADYTYPGVYIEEQTLSATPISAAGTSTAAFVGHTAIDELPQSTERDARKGKAILIKSWRDYEQLFGGIKVVKPSALSGGDPCGVTLSTASIPKKVNNTTPGTAVITVTQGILQNSTIYKLKVGSLNISKTFAVGKTDADIATTLETELTGAISGLTVAVTVSGGNKVITLSNSSANPIPLIDLEVVGGYDVPDYMGHSVQAFFYNGGGRAYIYHKDAHTWSDVSVELELYRDISLLLTPDVTNPTDPEITTHLNKMGNRLWLTYLDEDVDVSTASKTAPDMAREYSYQALYYSWIEVSNPDYDPDLTGSPPTYFIPPVGFVAGNFARIDAQRGFWKSPAGLETSILGGLRVKTPLSDSMQGELNPKHVNCIRKFGSSLKIWGARTLHKGQWKYLAGRRIAMMLEESIYNGIQWAVFEPNDSNLWASLRQTIETFMSGLHTAGAFMGEKASDAFFVRCGLGATMTEEDIAQGRVIIEVGFAPVNPAEFVIVRISQKSQVQN